MGAGAEAGYALNPDYNGKDQEGFAHWQFTIKNGRRLSAADAYLRPALRTSRVDVLVHATASRVLFEGTHAVGVEY